VWQSTSAAFTASTDNAGNSWKAGTVALSTTTSAIFSTGPGGAEGALRPGATGSRCLHVDYAGDLPATVKLYVTTPAGGLATLDQYLVMSIEQGQTLTTATDPAVTPDCAHFSPATFRYNTAEASADADQAETMSDLKATHGSYADGITVGTTVAQGTSLTFKVTYWVQNDDRAQGKQTDATFTWQAENA